MDIQPLLVPYDTGRFRWRSGAGPEHLIQAGLAAHLQARGHFVADIQVINDDSSLPLTENRTGFELIRRLARAVRETRGLGRFPLVLSGNCNSAVGTLSGLAPTPRSIFWFDAHGDINTPETTDTGFLDGMGLAMALGMCWHRLTASVPGFLPVSADATFLLGVRDLDPPEAAFVAGSPITSVKVSEIPAKLPELLANAPLDDTLGYIHLDLDVLDPRVGQANSLPVPGGLSVEQLTAAIAAIRSRTELGAAALASYAPEFDLQQSVCRAAFAAVDAMLTGDSQA